MQIFLPIIVAVAIMWPIPTITDADVTELSGWHQATCGDFGCSTGWTDWTVIDYQVTTEAEVWTIQVDVNKEFGNQGIVIIQWYGGE